MKNPALESPGVAAAPAKSPLESEETSSRGVTWRAVLLALGMATMFGLFLPIIDLKFSNTFLGSMHMPAGAIAVLLDGGPGRFVDVASAAPASMISSALMLDMRGFLLPSFVQGFKLAHDRKIALKPLLALIAVAVLLSYALGIWVIVRLGYEVGGLRLANWWASAAGSQPAVHTAGIVKGIETNFLTNWGWVGGGGLITWLIMLARSRFAWFPLHPIGLLMCVPFAMHSMWLSIFLGWACKITISKFAGNDGYRKSVPFFLGLTLGSIVMIVFWVCIDGWQGKMGHALLPF